MIKTEFYETRDDGVNLYRTYSTDYKQIRQIQTGAVYDEAIDVENSEFTYEETEDSAGVLEPQQTLDLIFGGNDDTV